jgi:hypothetical protein
MRPVSRVSDESSREDWVVYRSDGFSATRLTVMPGETTTVVDSAAYGTICVQGRGRFGQWSVEAPTMIRFGQVPDDEFFVSEQSAIDGVTIVNESKTDELVLLKHFGPGNPDRPLISAQTAGGLR